MSAAAWDEQIRGARADERQKIALADRARSAVLELTAAELEAKASFTGGDFSTIACAQTEREAAAIAFANLDRAAKAATAHRIGREEAAKAAQIEALRACATSWRTSPALPIVIEKLAELIGPLSEYARAIQASGEAATESDRLELDRVVTSLQRVYPNRTRGDLEAQARPEMRRTPCVTHEEAFAPVRKALAELCAKASVHPGVLRFLIP